MAEPETGAKRAAMLATLPRGLPASGTLLIGVFGKTGDRRALVRLDTGSVAHVSTGDSLLGGIVTAIGERSLRFERPDGVRSLDLVAAEAFASSPRPRREPRQEPHPDGRPDWAQGPVRPAA